MSMVITKSIASVALTGKYAGSSFRYHPSKAVALGHRHASFEPEEQQERRKTFDSDDGVSSKIAIHVI